MSDSLTDDHHEWASKFCGIDTRASAPAPSADDAGAAQSADSPPSQAAPGGMLSSISDAVGSAGTAVSDATSSVVSSAETAVQQTYSAAAKVVSGTTSDQGASDTSNSSAIAAPAALASVPAPVSAPGIVGEIEEAAESGVREVVQAAPEIAEGVGEGAEIATAVIAAPALGAVAIGGAALAAVMLWSSDGDAAWDGMTNPDTGKPFTSQQEYDQWKAGSKGKHPQNPIVTPVPEQAPDADNHGNLNSGGDCDGKFRSIVDQRKALEDLYQEALDDVQDLYGIEKLKHAGNPKTSWTGHKNSFESQRTELNSRINTWELNCKEMQLTDAQREDLKKSKEWADKEFPDKPTRYQP
jgi:hypothetical protein